MEKDAPPIPPPLISRGCQATELLLRRLRDSDDASYSGTLPRDYASEHDILIREYGYSLEDASRAVTICHEMRRLQAAGVSRVAAAEELTRRVLDRQRGVLAGDRGGDGRGGGGVRAELVGGKDGVSRRCCWGGVGVLAEGGCLEEDEGGLRAVDFPRPVGFFRRGVLGLSYQAKALEAILAGRCYLLRARGFQGDDRPSARPAREWLRGTGKMEGKVGRGAGR